MNTTRREINEFIATVVLTGLLVTIVNAGVMTLLVMGVPALACMIISIVVQLGVYRFFRGQIRAAEEALVNALHTSQDFVINGFVAAGNWFKGLFGNNNLSAA